MGLALGALLSVAPDRASAQGRLDAQYEASLAGIPVGKGAWTIEIGEDQYSASAFGGTSGLLKAFSGGSGTGARRAASSMARWSRQLPASTTTSKKTEAIHITLSNGTVKDIVIEPAPPVDPDRIPVTDAHKKGVSIR